MSIILITTLVITLIGILVGAGLVYTGKKFHVEVDEKESAVRAALPGNNCGGCGYAGCDALAAAIAKGEAPVNSCPVGGAPVTKAIGEIMGTEAEAPEPKVAFVRCKGTCAVTKNQGNYVGIQDCKTAVLGGIRTADCDYGCLGLGTCVRACPEHAIKIIDGVAVVSRSKCIGCGVCVKACPKGIIELVPVKQRVIVQCMNLDRGPAVRKVCSAGCIGCMLCTKQCEFDAVHVNGNLAKIDYDKCVQCGKCAAKCPAKVITPPAVKRSVSE